MKSSFSDKDIPLIMQIKRKMNAIEKSWQHASIPLTRTKLSRGTLHLLEDIGASEVCHLLAFSPDILYKVKGITSSIKSEIDHERQYWQDKYGFEKPVPKTSKKVPKDLQEYVGSPLRKHFRPLSAAERMTPVTELGLLALTSQILITNGIKTLGELAQQSYEDLMALPGFELWSVRKTIQAYRDFLDKNAVAVLEDSDSELEKAKEDHLDDSLELLHLSTRAYNALRRNKIHTLSQLMIYSKEQLRVLPNLGKATLDEIIVARNNYLNFPNAAARPISEATGKASEESDFTEVELTRISSEVVNKENEVKQDSVGIEELKLSSRASNILHRNSIHTIDQLLSYSEEKLRAIPKLGIGTLQEIMEARACFSEIEKVEYSPQAEPEIYSFVYDTPVSEFPLPVKCKNALISAGIDRLSKLAPLSEYEIGRIRNLGEQSIYKIINARDQMLKQVLKSKPCVQPIKISLKKDINEQVIQIRDNLAQYVLDEDHGKLHNLVYQKLHGYLQEDLPITEFRRTVVALPELLRMFSKRLLQLLTSFGRAGMPEDYLRSNLPKDLCEEHIQEIYRVLIETGKVRRDENNTLYFKEKSVFDVIAKIPDERARYILEQKLSCRSYEDISEYLGITKERVRQIQNKAIRIYINRQRYLLEDNYRSFFTNYHMTYQEFCSIFSEKREVWEYLNLRYKRGELAYTEALQDADIPEFIKKAIRAEQDSHYLSIEGKKIPLKRSDLENYYISNYCKEAMSIDALFEGYNSFLKENGVAEPAMYISEDSYKSQENKIANSNTVLWSQYRVVRYYNIADKDFSELLEVINLEQYHDIEISTLKLMREYPELMQRFDIRNEYELHNLLKKLGVEKIVSGLDIIRMPGLRFGEFDRGKYALELMIENAPISRDDLVSLISQNTGFVEASVRANWLSDLNTYYHQGMYSADYQEMPTADMEILRRKLVDEFYTFDEVRRIYNAACTHADSKLITTYNLKKLGFNVFSGYILKNHSTAESYLRHVLTGQDIVDCRELSSRFPIDRTYWGVVNALKHEYEIVEFQPQKIISIRRLKSMGVDKTDLKHFCDQVYGNVQNGEFFTIFSLRMKECSFELDKLGFEDWFYTSLLRVDNRFVYMKTSSGAVFCKGEEAISRRKLLKAIILEYGSLRREDIVDIVMRKFGYAFDKYDIPWIASDGELYYDDVMDTVYLDYATYEAEN